MCDLLRSMRRATKDFTIACANSSRFRTLNLESVRLPPATNRATSSPEHFLTVACRQHTTDKAPATPPATDMAGPALFASSDDSQGLRHDMSRIPYEDMRGQPELAASKVRAARASSLAWPPTPPRERDPSLPTQPVPRAPPHASLCHLPEQPPLDASPPPPPPLSPHPSHAQPPPPLPHSLPNVQPALTTHAQNPLPFFPAALTPAAPPPPSSRRACTASPAAPPV